MGMNLGDSGDLNSEINVTPMIDVMLVLLVIFMITAPLMNKTAAVDIDLPNAVAKQVDAKDEPLILEIDGAAKIKLGTTPIPWAELATKLKANEKAKAQGLYIAADQALDYGVVVTAMAIAKNAGVSKVMMLTDPTEVIPVEELDARK